MRTFIELGASNNARMTRLVFPGNEKVPVTGMMLHTRVCSEY
jgi:hypothetical protein